MIMKKLVVVICQPTIYAPKIYNLESAGYAGIAAHVRVLMW